MDKRTQRRMVGVRIELDDLAVIDAIAEREGVTRSEALRRLVAGAIEHETAAA